MKELKIFFKKFPIDTIFSYFFLGASILFIAVAVPFSLTEKINILDDSGIIREVYLLDQTSPLFFDNFIEYDVKERLDLVISYHDNASELPQNWNAHLQNAMKRGVKIRIYTNNKSYVPPSGIQIHYFADDSLGLNVNFAIGDNQSIFFPSTFFATKEKRVQSFLVLFRKCPSLVQDLYQIFDMLWNKPDKLDGAVQKKRWMADKGFKSIHKDGIQFLISPTSEFPVGRNNNSFVLKDLLKSKREKKVILTSSFYPQDIHEYYSAASAAYYASLLESELNIEEIINLTVSRDEYLNHTEPYHSMSFTMVNNSISYCDQTYEGSIIAATGKLLLIQGDLSQIIGRKNYINIGVTLDALHDEYVMVLNEYIAAHETVKYVVCD